MSEPEMVTFFLIPETNYDHESYDALRPRVGVHRKKWHGLEVCTSLREAQDRLGDSCGSYPDEYLTGRRIFRIEIPVDAFPVSVREVDTNPENVTVIEAA